MIRIFDVILSGVGLIVTFPLLIIITVIGFINTGSPLFCQLRVGRGQRPFTLVKFRTMPPDTISVATHLVDPSTISAFGRFLRRYKLDELPQLWNVLRGDMSMVGPRPCLFNQNGLIEERASRQVFDARPGITGLAQIQGIDMSMPRLLAETDAKMLEELSMITYLKFVLLTFIGQGRGDRVQEG